MSVDTFHLDHLSELFQTNRNRKNALDMSKYMKGHFYFFGIKSPLRQKIMREWWQEQSIKNEFDLKCLISSLWKLDEREFQYVALDFRKRFKRFSRQNPFHSFESVLQQNPGGIPWMRLPAILPGLLSINILKQEW